MQMDFFRENYENRHGKVLRAIYAARSLAIGTIGRDIAPTVLFKIFDTQIQPIIAYSSEVCYDRKVNRAKGQKRLVFQLSFVNLQRAKETLMFDAKYR